MSEKTQFYPAYLDVLEMLLSLDERTADTFFYEFSGKVSTMDYLNFNTAYRNLKIKSSQTKDSLYQDCIMELAILIKMNPEWAQTRFEYWMDHIPKKNKREAFYFVYRYLLTGKISFRITPKNKLEAIAWLRIMLKASIEYADQYYEAYSALIISKEGYDLLKTGELKDKLYNTALQDLDTADRFYRVYTANMVSEGDYSKIKRRAIQDKLQLLLNRRIEEADAFYDSFGRDYLSFEAYHQIKRPVLMDLLKNARTLRDADSLFENQAKGIVSQVEYDSIRKTFVLNHLRDLCALDLEQAEAYYRQEAFSVVSKEEFDEIMERPRTLARLQQFCDSNIRDADCFYADQAYKIVTQQEYRRLKRPVLLKQLKTVCEQSVPEADALFVDCAKNAVSLEEYVQIKRSVLMATLKNEYPENQRSADQFYASYARDLITIEEYNEIRRPVATCILQERFRKNLSDAESFYKSYAKDILTEEDYNEIRKPFLLSELQKRFEEDYIDAIQYYYAHLKQIVPEDEFQKEAGEFVSSWFATQKSAGRFINNLPDPDQSQAIAMIHGNVLVTARAGSGKTATMINRAYFMIKHCRIPAEEILMLAFNREAAKEMHSRLHQLLAHDDDVALLSLPYIMTFHALAFRLVLPEEAILYDEKKNGPQMQSRLLQEKIIGEYLEECLKTHRFATEVRKLMMDYFRVNIDDSKFLPRDEFLSLKRSTVQESLKGDAVKSYGEKRIANFLFEHDVEYIYERSFRWNWRSYRPDFTIPTNKRFGKKGGLIVEYLGLQGDPEYDRQTEEKRAYWSSRPEWQLIEVVPADMNRTDAEFEAWFREILKMHRIPCRKLSEDEIWERARTHAIDAFTSAMRSFIQRCRKLCISPDDLHTRILEFQDGTPEELLFANLAEKFYRSYLNRVKATGQDDFDGLMIRAIDKVQAGETVFLEKHSCGDLAKIQYIAIDEYQDFSELFYRLIVAIRWINPKVNLYCVGDNWQAINGFAGSDLRFFRNFDRCFGHSIHIELLNNYRSNKAIVDAGNALMRGLGTPGRVAPSANHTAGKVYLCCAEDFSPTELEQEKYGFDNISPMVRRIIHSQQKRGHSVALLDRRSMISKEISSGEEDFNDRTRELSALKENMQLLFPGIDLVSSTVHSFKGLEKDAVILLDVTENCFPLIHPNWRFSRIIGENISEIIEAERRLLYVALTRARCDLYLLTEHSIASHFLDSICEYAQVMPMEWQEYTSDLNRNSLFIEVGNQPGRGISPTHDIRELLKQAGFLWSMGQKVWTKNIDTAAYDPDRLRKEEWYVHADGIVVHIYNAERELIDTLPSPP